MNKKTLVGSLCAIVAVFLLLAVFNSGNQTSLAKWPVEGFQNLAFSIGWLSPFPDSVVYVITVLIILLVAALFYRFGTWLVAAK
ncbi:hypothetical protein [Psychrobacter phenylpyruvicus]|uniref:Uncharacterized protein n=1 Tax=Psychrobacter phenylpyruvicus TaxID=29432 RepID=A0A379LPF1_9GAMM|nr:hypothetical protein [Psychrobacter phenylpyruvicus]SUD92311.1 Uncharacterised protein [Psychrobacter phenylpyruvicus]